MKNLVLLIFLITGTLSLAQNPEEIRESRPQHNLNLSFLGDASLFSMNYEKQFLVNPNFMVSSKLGLGFNQEFKFCVFGPCPPRENYATIPHHFTGNIGKGRHFFEFGLGGTWVIGQTSQPYLLYPIIGYRFLPLLSKRVNFRLFIEVPVSGLETDDIFFFPVGINIGISLK